MIKSNLTDLARRNFLSSGARASGQGQGSVCGDIGGAPDHPTHPANGLSLSHAHTHTQVMGHNLLAELWHVVRDATPGLEMRANVSEDANGLSLSHAHTHTQVARLVHQIIAAPCTLHPRGGSRRANFGTYDIANR